MNPNSDGLDVSIWEKELETKSKAELISLLKKVTLQKNDLEKRFNLSNESPLPQLPSIPSGLQTPVQEKALLDLGSIGSNSIYFLRAADTSVGVETDTSTVKVRNDYLQLERGSKAFKAPDVMFYKNLFKSTFVLDYDVDSPCFRARLEEMDSGVDDLRNHLQKLVDKCRLYSEKGNSYSVTGRKFCSFLLKLQDDIWVSRLGDVAPLLSNFGFVLDEIQSYRDGVLSSIETTFSAPMEEFVKREVKLIKKLKLELHRAGEEYEAALSKFLQLKSNADAETRRAKEIEVATLRKKFELHRYDVVVELNSLASKKKFQLCERVCSALYAYLGYFHQCHTLLATIEPAVRQLTAELNSARKDFAKEQLLMAARRTQLRRELDEAQASPGGKRLKSQYKIRKYWKNKKSKIRKKNDSTSSFSYEECETAKEEEEEEEEKYTCRGSDAQSPQTQDSPSDRFDEFVKSGYLWKRSTNLSRTWQRRWFFIRDGTLYYTHCTDAAVDAAPHPVCNLMISTVKVNSEPDLKFTFEVISPGQRRYVLQAESEQDVEDWIRALRQQIEGLIASSNDGGSLSAPARNTAAGTTVATNSAMLNSIRAKNPFCAECGAENPEWASLNLCLVLCIECSGIHRGLGSHISKVRSLTLDTWYENYVSLLEQLGNDAVTPLWEANIGAPRFPPKPTPTSSREEKEAFVAAKYNQRAYVPKVSPEEYNDLLFVSSGAEDLVGMIRAISLGADINYRHPKHGLRTALHSSCAQKCLLAVELLCLFNASVDEKDLEGKTPLDYIGGNDDKSVQIFDILIHKLEHDLQC